MKVGIYVLNYNGKDILEMCLPSIKQAAEASIHDCNVVIVDNLSVDGSEDLVRTKFPDFEFRVMKENRVLCSFNDVAKDAREDILIFLNNDLKADPGFIDPLVRVILEKNDAFLAVPCCMSFDGTKVEVERTDPVFKWGLIKGVPAPEGEHIKTLTYTLQGGFGAFDRKKFLELGGYDDLYLPGIIEDTDLCVRAWKKGYASYYQPESVIYHMGRASFKKAFGLKRLLAISHRNTYLFAWKNLRGGAELTKHIFFIPPRLIYSLLTGKYEIAWGFFGALGRLAPALSRRARDGKEVYRYTMRQALERMSRGSWGDFYSSVSDEKGFEHNISIHRPFLDRIAWDCPEKLLEVGSGSGTMAAFLSFRAESVVSVDNDESVLRVAEENNRKFGGKVAFRKEDAFNLSFEDDSFDVAFSQGFLEHFSDKEIKCLITEQLRVAKKIVFSVPTIYYRTRDFGNERLLSMRKWRKILKDFTVEDDRYYLYSRRKKNFLINLPMMYMVVVSR